MPRLDSVKRRMLEEAVDHNVALAMGRRLRVRRPDRLLQQVLRASLTVAGLASIALGLALRPDAGASASAGGESPASTVTTTASDSPGPPPRFSVDPRRVDPAVFPLAVRTVVVDPGHGGEQLGTRTPIGLLEKDLTLDIALRLEGHLKARNYTVVMTRSADTALPLRERTDIANGSAGDIFVSIHVNWIETRSTRGVETYYLGPTDDPVLERLAARENLDSGYRLADLRSILDHLYTDARQNESGRLARAVQRSLLTALRQVNPDIQDRGVKTAPFVVLTTSEMPAILAEVSCLSNDEEAELLRSEAYRDRIATALADGLDGYARARARQPERNR